MTYQRWTAIDLGDPETFPPLHEPVLMFMRGPDYRRWHIFHNVDQLKRLLETAVFTHWRELMTVDSP